MPGELNLFYILLYGYLEQFLKYIIDIARIYLFQKNTLGSPSETEWRAPKSSALAYRSHRCDPSISRQCCESLGTSEITGFQLPVTFCVFVLTWHILVGYVHSKHDNPERSELGPSVITGTDLWLA